MKTFLMCLMNFFIMILLFSKSAVAEISYTNSDKERIDGLHKIAKTIELYKSKTGRYPFSNAPRSRPGLQFIVVHMTDQSLSDDDIYPPYGITGAHIGMQTLFEEFARQGILDNVNFVYDTRKVTAEDKCQKYFIYNWNGHQGCYNLSINLEKNVQKNNYKLDETCYPYVISSCKEQQPPYKFVRGSK